MPVRPYEPADFAAVCRIYADARRDELRFENHAFDITPLERDDAILAAFNESVVLVFEDGDVLGFAATFGGQLRALFVGRDARGKGIGQALLDAVLAHAAAGVSLNVAKSNLDAVRFYRRNGFSAVGETVRRYAGVDVPYIQMRSGAWTNNSF
jgi:ribosomal protein S18 acetylase RimI-like enzyme